MASFASNNYTRSIQPRLVVILVCSFAVLFEKQLLAGKDQYDLGCFDKDMKDKAGLMLCAFAMKAKIQGILKSMHLCGVQCFEKKTGVDP